MGGPAWWNPQRGVLRWKLSSSAAKSGGYRRGIADGWSEQRADDLVIGSNIGTTITVHLDNKFLRSTISRVGVGIADKHRHFRARRRKVVATPKRIRQAIHTTESEKTAQRRYYLTTSSPHHSWLGKTRRFGPAYLRALSAERRPTNCRTRRAEAFFLNIIFTTAEHNELRLRPVVPRKQKSEWKFVSNLPVLELPRFIATETHDWAPRQYECCLAVVERPYEAWSQPAKVDLLWKFCGWPSLLGGLQKRSGTFEHRSTAMIIQAKVRRCRSVTY
ncbi:BZ3500_MvSof-1268-A1-R1_Chr9g10740 [Microbotryum saponariae]|uniref:BZ3500_MvSof-1268-A1-R1_Chr9g10740 protein n=1 Tax=Microbotryum saponariae TaxID=289078 RepID=A0A2X0L223_9BASI|nr:BZ3501_MvSof-1269-A2-R1_Chr9g10488 [Microbotryum saponariae]SDA00611.1 BZ3500_MvSof-1268-A1-R1_Chr9g10740 [Microbotryum saponariae]